MIDLGLKGEREVAARFEEMPRALLDRLLERIGDLTGRLYDAIEADEPEGKSGRLRSETGSRVTDRGTRITGSVAVTAEFAKAGALEYGAHRSTTVSAHQARLTHVFGRVASLEVQVGAHTRRLNIAERRFLRDPVAAMRGEIEAEIQAAVDEGTRG